MRLQKFFENIQQDLKVFFFLLLLICLYRAYFLWYMSGYMGPGTSAEDVALALWVGLRLSLKSAGACALLGFAFCTLPNIVRPGLPLGKARLFFGTASSFLLSVLFQLRFPYYRQFHMTYGQQVVHGLHDDIEAIFVTAVREYGLHIRLLAAVLLTVAAWYLLKRLLRAPGLSLPEIAGLGKKIAVSLVLAAVTFLFMLFMRFGGSFNYEKSVNWGNAGVTGDAFLNECILDDFQGLYRARTFWEQMNSGEIEGVDPARMREFCQGIAGHGDLGTEDIVPYLERRAQGARLPMPRRIFIILGESWAQWPMLEKYADLHVADGIKRLAAREDAYSTMAFLPNGDFTSIAISGLVTGLNEVGIGVSYQARTYEEIFPTAMAPQFHRLGYDVDFWYGGFPSWDNLERFSLAQGFDHFYGCPDYHAPKQSIWGTTDGQLLTALAAHLPEEEKPTVHLIMTITNHPPYNLDLAAEGFDVEREKTALAGMPNVEDADTLAMELGHYWYMDKVVSEFVEETLAKYPDSLFVITGDHAVRTDPGTQPTIFEHQSVPFVLCGAGVGRDTLSPNAAGGHTGIVPTLIELIAPEGFSYSSIAPSMTQDASVGFNRDVWATQHAIGEISSDRAECLPGVSEADFAADKALAWERILPMRTISWWLLQKGNRLERTEHKEVD